MSQGEEEELCVHMGIYKWNHMFDMIFFVCEKMCSLSFRHEHGMKLIHEK